MFECRLNNLIGTYFIFSRTVSLRAERLIFSVWRVFACLLVDSYFTYLHQMA